MSKKIIVTIGRQYGSGGHLVGKKLAEMLSYDYYDKSLFDKAAQLSGVKRECFERSDEKSPMPTIGIEMGMAGVYGTPFFGSVPSLDEGLFKYLSHTILDIANGDKGAVIVGRCADYILRNHPDLFSVFIHAPLADRIKRTAEREHLSERKALEMIKKQDKQRANFYNFYSGNKWGEAATYSLCINSSTLGIDRTCDMLASMVKTIIETDEKQR